MNRTLNNLQNKAAKRKSVYKNTLKRSECWVANVLVSETTCRELVNASFLKPQRTEAGYVLSICTIFTKNEAPVSQSCFLAINCVNMRNNEHVLWMGNTHSDSNFFLKSLTLPKEHLGLSIERGRDFYKHRQFNVHTPDNRIDLRLIEYPELPAASSNAFADVEAFKKYFWNSHYCYVFGAFNNTCKVIEFQQQDDSVFEAMTQYYGYLRTAWGNWRVESVYRCHDLDFVARSDTTR